MFNVIKGGMVNINSSPVLIKEGEKKELKEKTEVFSQELISIREEISEKKIVLLELIEEIKKKEDEYKNIENLIAEKLNEANKEVERMFEEAKEKIEYEINISKNMGFQEGYQVGSAAGKEEIIEKSIEILKKCENILEEVLKFKEESILENEKEIIDIAFSIAEKIIKKEINQDKEIIRNVLKEALRKVPISKKLTVIVNWSDLDYIKEIKQKLFSEIRGVENIEIIEDESIEKGGCILETSIGTINATIKSQLETLYNKIMEDIKNEN